MSLKVLGKAARGIFNEADVVVHNFQEFGPVSQLFENAILFMVLVDDKIPIVLLEVVGKYIDLVCLLGSACPTTQYNHPHNVPL